MQATRFSNNKGSNTAISAVINYSTYLPCTSCVYVSNSQYNIMQIENWKQDVIILFLTLST